MSIDTQIAVRTVCLGKSFGPVHVPHGAPARQASVAATESNVEDLQDAVVAMHQATADGDWDAFTEADVAFHRALLVASGNLIVAQFSEPIEAALRVWRRLNLVPSDLSQEVVDAHQAIIESIVRGDAPGVTNIP